MKSLHIIEPRYFYADDDDEIEILDLCTKCNKKSGNIKLICCNKEICQICYKRMVEVNQTCPYCNMDYSQLPSSSNRCLTFFDDCDTCYGLIDKCKEHKNYTISAIVLWVLVNYIFWFLLDYLYIYSNQLARSIVISIWYAFLTTIFIPSTLIVIILIFGMILYRCILPFCIGKNQDI